MPCRTMKEKSKATTKPYLVASYDIQPGKGVGLFWDTKHTTHIFTFLLSPDPHGEKKSDYLHAMNVLGLFARTSKSVTKKT